MRYRQRTQEQKSVDTLLSQLNLGVSLVDPDHYDKPDFRLELGNGTIVGLEVTQLVDEGRARGQSAQRRFRDALGIALSQKGLVLDVYVSVHDGCDESIGSAEEKAKHVAAIVRLVETRNGDSYPARVQFEQEDLDRAGAPLIRRLLVKAEPKIIVMSGCNYRGPNFPFIDQKIKEKDRKIASYRANLPMAKEFWLLLVAGDHAAGSIWHEIAQGHPYQTLFDRVFYSDAREGHYFEMKVIPRSA